MRIALKARSSKLEALRLWIEKKSRVEFFQWGGYLHAWQWSLGNPCAWPTLACRWQGVIWPHLVGQCTTAVCVRVQVGQVAFLISHIVSRSKYEGYDKLNTLTISRSRIYAFRRCCHRLFQCPESVMRRVALRSSLGWARAMRIKASMVKNGTGISFFEILALARDLVLGLCGR